MTIGIYKITHLESGKVYIGQSRNIEKRFIYYRCLSCKTQTKLYNAFVKYGLDAFEFKVLLRCDPENLDMYENLCIEAYKASTEGYNIKHKANGNGAHSAETKAKISAAQRGKPMSEEHKAKIGATLKGRIHKPMSEETKAKIALGNKGKTVSPETRAKMSAALKTFRRAAK